MVPITACTDEYLTQAKLDQAEAAILYNTSSTTNTPSSALTVNAFTNPIYGIPETSAGPLLEELVNYAGNMSSVPKGFNLTAIYDPADFVRLTATIDTGQGSSLPGLWLFLLVILAALGLIIASTSISMHVSQYRARRDLRRRIAAGEIDLESLGIKRLTVPEEMIHAMPIKIYGAETNLPRAISEKDTSTPLRRPSGESKSQQSTLVPGQSSETQPAAESAKQVQDTSSPSIKFEQPQNCAICLDDYVVNITPVRHLPCNHIFHPHCVDPFLATRSSLCPLCKRSVLPKGFIPPTLQLSNATVARERRIRLMRDRARQEDTNLGNMEMTEMAEGQVNAPSQEDEEDELRRRPLGRRVLEVVFPRFTRPTGTFSRFTRRAPNQA